MDKHPAIATRSESGFLAGVRERILRGLMFLAALLVVSGMAAYQQNLLGPAYEYAAPRLRVFIQPRAAELVARLKNPPKLRMTVGREPK